MSAVRAARRIVAACRRGEAEVVLALLAELVATVHAIAPGGTADLPAAVWLTALNERAAARHNQTRPRKAQDQEVYMPRCETCGNDYDKTMEITQQGRRHIFDSFECAIHVMAPTCEHCGCRIVGHGVESNGRMFCCAHCAHEVGIAKVRA